MFKVGQPLKVYSMSCSIQFESSLFAPGAERAHIRDGRGRIEWKIEGSERQTMASGRRKIHSTWRNGENDWWKCAIVTTGRPVQWIRTLRPVLQTRCWSVAVRCSARTPKPADHLVARPRLISCVNCDQLLRRSVLPRISQSTWSATYKCLVSEHKLLNYQYLLLNCYLFWC